MSEDIGNLTDLHELDIGKNNLSKLPDSIFKLRNSCELFLYENIFSIEYETEINLSKHFSFVYW